MKLYFVNDPAGDCSSIFVKKRDAIKHSKENGFPEPEEHNYPVTKKGMLNAMRDASNFVGNEVEIQ